jgi:toxin CptA
VSSGNFESTVELRLGPSRKALMWALWVHALPAAALPFAMAPGIVMVILAALIALSWVGLRHHPALGFGPRALSRLQWNAEGEWTVWRGAASTPAQLLDNSVVHPQLLLLRFRLPDGKTANRLILGDETAAELLRRLRARLALRRP